MRHGHGTTSNSPKQRARRATQPARDIRKAERNRQRARGGGQLNELGITEGQNGEQGNTVNPELGRESGKIRH
jgi:hypothetical protein